MALPINPIQKRDNYICRYCGRDGLASLNDWHECCIDHFTPRKYGGTDDPSNLVTSCSYCNAIKGDALFESIDQARAFIAERRSKLQAQFEAVRNAVRAESANTAPTQF